MSISHEAIYRHIYTRPQARLNKKLIKLLVRKKTRRRTPKKRRGGGSKITAQNIFNAQFKQSNRFSEYVVSDTKTFILPRILMFSIGYNL
jgi:IS30 family transposase